jgi:hypothetical protein
MKKIFKVWTQFESTHYDKHNKVWVTENNYYMGNWFNTDLSKHWQTKEVKDSKKQLIPTALYFQPKWQNPLQFLPKKTLIKVKKTSILFGLFNYFSYIYNVND